MAARPKGFGYTAELKDKQDAKYSVEREREAKAWLQAVVGESFPSGTFHEALKDGVYLCKLVNKLRPGSVKKINTGKMAFKMMENIGNFLEAAYAYGLPKSDGFQTVDLYEAANMAQVVNALHALGRQAQKNRFTGPSLGPKEASKNVRGSFDRQSQLEAATTIGLQMGSTKGASQAGMTPYGLQRQVNKPNLK